MQKLAVPVIALVQADGLRTVTRWVARALADRHHTPVVVCPWWQLRFAAGTVTADGPVWQTDRQRGRLGRVAVRGLPVEVLYSDGFSGARRPGTAAEQDAMRRLATLGIGHPGMLRRQIIRQLLLEASRRGVITNANADYQSWDAKDGLEFTLRRYENASGQVIPRPRTYCVSAQQLPAAIQALGAKGIYSIVKPATGGLARACASPRPTRSSGTGFRPAGSWYKNSSATRCS